MLALVGRESPSYSLMMHPAKTIFHHISCASIFVSLQCPTSSWKGMVIIWNRSIASQPIWSVGICTANPSNQRSRSVIVTWDAELNNVARIGNQFGPTDLSTTVLADDMMHLCCPSCTADSTHVCDLYSVPLGHVSNHTNFWVFSIWPRRSYLDPLEKATCSAALLASGRVPNPGRPRESTEIFPDRYHNQSDHKESSNIRNQCGDKVDNEKWIFFEFINSIVAF